MMKQALVIAIVTLGAATATFAADESFVTKAAGGGSAEVELGKLATGKASSEAVRKFGQRMIDDHSRANNELMALAQRKNVVISPELGPEERALRDHLMTLSGPAFDQAYMKAMLSDHMKDVNDFRIESQSGKDPDVKAWAAKTLPTLEEHLNMARNINSTFGTSAAK
jgi:putative membrane protein